MLFAGTMSAGRWKKNPQMITNPSINRNEPKVTNQRIQMKQFTAIVAVAVSSVVSTEAFAPHAVPVRWRQAVATRQHQIVEMTPRSQARRRRASCPPTFFSVIRLYGQTEDDELRQAEDDAAFDAHDCPDAGMEAAAEERAVMMAEAMHLTPKHEIHAEMEDHERSIDPWSRLSVDEVDAAELEQAEEDAAYDAHDCADAGMEAAAEERAVMMAYDMAEKRKEEARKKNSE